MQDRSTHRVRRHPLRQWIVEPRKFDKYSMEVSKQMLRHDETVLRKEDGAVEFRILASMFHSKFTSSPYWSICKEEVVQRRDISIVWIHALLTPSDTFEQFKATLEENTLILHCKTTGCYRATSPSTSTTVEAHPICTRSFNQDWFRVAKTSRKGGTRCSSRP